MRQTIELKHVGPRAHVKHLLEKLIGRLEQKLAHWPPDVVSVHVLCEENGNRSLYRTSITCHVPGRMLAAHEEHREAWVTIHQAFEEIGRQVEKHKALQHGDPPRRRAAAASRDARAAARPSEPGFDSVDDAPSAERS